LSAFYLVAEIKEVYKKREGFLSVLPVTDFPGRFVCGLKVYIDVFNDKNPFIIENAVEEKGKLLLKFKNFNTSEDVSFLVGKKIYVTEDELIELPENTFYIHDLTGCKVYKNNKFFGNLIDVLSLPANDVYVIKNSEGKEILVPAVESFIDKINIKEKRIDLSEKFEFENDED